MYTLLSTVDGRVAPGSFYLGAAERQAAHEAM